MNYFDLIDVERNIYQLAELYPQNRREVESYLDILQDPSTGIDLHIENDKIIGDRAYVIENNVPDFTIQSSNTDDWIRLNKQFLNYHKSLSPYTLINSAPIINYLSLKSGIGLIKGGKVLDVGGGTGHTYCSFFQYPETIEYFLLDPNLRLLHDQFLRIYPKLSFLKIGHILAHAESLPIKENSFDVVLSLSAIDHLDDYKRFISEAFRVLKPGGKFMIYSHLDVPPAKEDVTTTKAKLFSHSFWERASRYLYLKKYAVGEDDHTLHLDNEVPIKDCLLDTGFEIKDQEVFKRYFYFVAIKN